MNFQIIFICLRQLLSLCSVLGYGNGYQKKGYENGHKAEEYRNEHQAEEYGNGHQAEEYRNGHQAEEYRNGHQAEEYRNGHQAEEYGNGHQEEEHGDKYRQFKKRPHIVLILSDDQGWNDVGFHNPNVSTPWIDRLANSGIILENSYVQPVCTPSRAAILTGYYPYRTGLQFGAVKPGDTLFLPLKFDLLPEYLKELGYSTHIFGKWHLGNCKASTLPNARGFDSFQGFLGGAVDYFTKRTLGVFDFWKNTDVLNSPNTSYVTDILTDSAIEKIETNPPDKPLFLYLPFSSPHSPLQVPDQFSDIYKDIRDPQRRTYLGMVSSIDFSVGRVIKALKRNRYMEDTVIIYMSDNGGDPNFGGSNSPLRGGKATLFEGGVKSVGFVYGPKWIRQRRCTHKGMIHAVDWLPTLLDLAGHPDVRYISKDIDGVSQLRYLKQCRGSARDEFIYNIDDDIGNAAAIRYGKYKLIQGEPRLARVILEPGQLPDIVPINPNSKDIRLFDLEADPYEEQNLASERPRLLKKISKRLNYYRQFGVTALKPPQVPPAQSTINGRISTEYC